MPDKKILIVQTKPPYGTSQVQESLDLILAGAAFEQNISVLISADACYQLFQNQQAERIDRKNTLKMFKALSVFGIEQVYIDQEDAGIRGLAGLEVPFITLTYLDKQGIQELYQSVDTVIHF